MSVLNKILRKAEKIGYINNRIANYFFFPGYQKKITRKELAGCFMQRPQEQTPPDMVFDRVIQAWKKTMDDFPSGSAIYSVSNEWLYIYQYYMADIMRILREGDADALKKMYANFMREKCSVGLHGLAIDMHKNFFDKPAPSGLHASMYLNDSNYRYEIWKAVAGLQPDPSHLYMPEYGNSYGYYKEGAYIRTGAEYLHYYATSIQHLLASKDAGRKTILEIGGGYGGLAYFLNRNIPNLTYIDLDLPENMALTAYYLLCCFPEKKILLYGEDSLDNIGNYDIAVLPNFCLDQLKAGSADLVFNSYSLAEMAPDTIQYYVSKIRSIATQYIFHVNHTNKSTSINADNFGFDHTGDFSLIYRAKAMWNMYRNYRCDEYEYLYKKTV